MLKNKLPIVSNRDCPRPLKPLKRLGQNFLVSSPVVRKVIEAANLQPSDIVLEVGPGTGALTIEIAKRVKKVVAVEKDKSLADILAEILKSQNINNVEIINQDILNFQFDHIVVILRAKPEGSHDRCANNETLRLTPQGDNSKNYKIIANLPYNIATAVIMKFLEAKRKPEVMVVMVQKEVGQRICAKPPAMSKLAVFCQLYAKPEIIGYVSKSNFYPRPKVDSAILGVRPVSDTGLTPKQNEWFAKIVIAGFSHPRKQLVNNLSKGLGITRQRTEEWLKQNNLNPSQRAETLSLQDWLNITKTFPD